MATTSIRGDDEPSMRPAVRCALSVKRSEADLDRLDEEEEAKVMRRGMGSTGGLITPQMVGTAPISDTAGAAAVTTTRAAARIIITTGPSTGAVAASKAAASNTATGIPTRGDRGIPLLLRATVAEGGGTAEWSRPRGGRGRLWKTRSAVWWQTRRNLPTESDDTEIVRDGRQRTA